MSKNHTVLLGAVWVSLSVAAGSAEAKLIRYEINGQRYSYSTNNHQQVREARQRIEAAAAKERADAERAANPLARIFGSPTQREAVGAQSRLQQAAAGEAQPDVVSTSSLGTPRAERQRFGQRRERWRALREARFERARKVDRPQQVAARIAPKQDVRPRLEKQAPTLPPQQAKPVATPPGIESALLSRGSSNPSPREPVLGESGGGSLTDFVNQVRKAPFGDAPRL